MRPRITGGAGLAEHAGTVVELVGRYLVVDTGPYRVAYRTVFGLTVTTRRIAVLELADGTRVRLSVRPRRERSRLDGRTVSAVGTLHLRSDTGPARMAAPLDRASLLDIERIEPA